MKMISWLVAVWFLAGCNTMQGIGKDLQQGGEVIQKAATK